MKKRMGNSPLLKVWGQQCNLQVEPGAADLFAFACLNPGGRLAPLRQRHTATLSMASPPKEIDQRIWQVVMLIPPGAVSTYGDVARMAGIPRGARRVGSALRKIPPETRIPWHRVINSQGRISLPDGSKSQLTQKERLEAEGIRFNSSKRIDLNNFRWSPGEATTKNQARF